MEGICEYQDSFFAMFVFCHFLLKKVLVSFFVFFVIFVLCRVIMGDQKNALKVKDKVLLDYELRSNTVIIRKQDEDFV